MANTSLRARAVVTPHGVLGPSTVEVRDGRIAMVRPAHGRVPDLTLVPGFVDLQVNGVGSIHVASADTDEAWSMIGRSQLGAGTTTWFPTVTTREVEEYPAILERITAAAARSARPESQPAEFPLLADIPGAHLEGPFLGERPGAHPTELIRPIEQGFISDLPDIVKLMTLAPEVDGAVEATRALVDRGVRVAIGHTGANEEQLEAVRQAGASLVTHLFNAMTGVSHRDPGVAAWALVNDAISTSVIADLHHVSLRVLQIALRCKPPQTVIAVTDAVAHLSQGLEDGGSGRPAHLPDGTIAGSTITMDGCYRNLRLAGASAVEATLATSTNPAALMGLADRGAIVAGLRADLVALDPRETVIGVWRCGEPTFPSG
ncbi:MAG: amidohydrolase family protein [Actinomycetia bacterium]|nr:amidohydrolase family protein [Actinomycetes bacterium]MCP4960641.1 amidohydrolase family protein [Actinomycetes bacterium]